ncbi:hypothetical protein ACWCQL_01900 [Streptomyces sp. NPDC002073]
MSDEPNQTESSGVNSSPGPDNELALRSLLQGAVADLAPSDDALERLRHAVPARRARKRRTAIGAAAAALLIGISVPSFVKVAASPDGSDDRPAIAGHGEQAHGGTGGITDPDLSWPGLPDPVARPAKTDGPGRGQPDQGRPVAGKTGDPGRTAGGSGGPGDGTGPFPPSSAAPAPVCQADQLGVALEETRSPDADGKVYGTFRITNVSQGDCKVSGPGAVTAVAAGSADSAKITVADHTAGDPATGLPSPAEEQTGLVLQPNTAYEIRFAWVPEQTCPARPGPDPTTSPDPASGGSGTTDGGTDPDTGTGTGDADGDGVDDTDPLGEGSDPSGETGGAGVEVTHIADPGAPIARTVIPDACAGTLYRTGVLPAEPAS